MKYGNLTLGQIEAGINKIGGEEAFMRLLRDELVISEVTVKKLLEFVKTISLPAIGTFVVADKLRVGETIDGIKVGWLGDNIKKHFLPKTEKNTVAAEELKLSKLLKGSRDPAIITEFGGEEKVEVSFGQYWEFLKTADQSLWYVAYIRDTDDVLWAVYGFWHDGGLYVEAYSLDNPHAWDADDRFLSR